jgi:hypothetical protein
MCPARVFFDNLDVNRFDGLGFGRKEDEPLGQDTGGPQELLLPVLKEGLSAVDLQWMEALVIYNNLHGKHTGYGYRPPVTSNPKASSASLTSA